MDEITGRFPVEWLHGLDGFRVGRGSPPRSIRLRHAGGIPRWFAATRKPIFVLRAFPESCHRSSGPSSTPVRRVFRVAQHITHPGIADQVDRTLHLGLRTLGYACSVTPLTSDEGIAVAESTRALRVTETRSAPWTEWNRDTQRLRPVAPPVVRTLINEPYR